MQVIWIVRQLHQRGYAVAPYWLSLFMTLFSAMTLLMFALSNEGGATVDEAWEAVNWAVWLFTELSSTSFIAERCAAVLKVRLQTHKPSYIQGPSSSKEFPANKKHQWLIGVHNETDHIPK